MADYDAAGRRRAGRSSGSSDSDLSPSGVQYFTGRALTFETVDHAESGGVLELAARVYQGLSLEDVDEIERIALDRTRFLASERLDHS